MTRFASSLIALVCCVPAAAVDDSIDYTRDILPLLAENCYECHGPDEQARQGDLRLDQRQAAFAELPSGKRAVVPGTADASELLRRIVVENEDERMPPSDSGKRLTEPQIARIRAWIEQGAKWKEHWAYVPPQRPTLPAALDEAGVRNAIDRFVRARLAAEGLQPSPEADCATLIRRVTLDLTGLPPTIAEVETFLQDTAPGAYERLVDRLLESPRYGERMALVWLDAARYADTHGYLFDTERQMWRWRDWVIEAFNENLPYDQFTVQQLAGDLLPDATLSQRIASGFNRNHIINNEAGATPAEYLVENVLDRVNTTSTVWLGLTLGCCQCHDHKYDPFTQREYYQLYAFFNNVPEVGLDGLNTNAKPLMKAPTIHDDARRVELKQQVAAAEERMAGLKDTIAAGQADWESTLSDGVTLCEEQLAAHWRFDKCLDDRIESTAAGNFKAGDATYVDGLLGDAASFDGKRFIDAGDRFNWAVDDSFTFAAWVRPSAKTGRFSIFSRMKEAKELFQGTTLQLVNGVPALFLIQTFPDNMIQVQGKTVLEPNTWHHVAVSYNGTGKAKGVKLYVNGKLEPRGITINKLSGPIQVDRPFWIGNGHPGALFKGEIDEVRVYDRVVLAEEIAALPGLSMDSLLAIDAADRNDEQTRRVRDHYLTKHAPAEWRDAHQTLAKSRTAIKKHDESLPTVMVMSEQKKPRETRILTRGAYDKPGDKVTAGTPAVLPSLGERPATRLGFARWLVDPKHPLTARVAVNRLWQMHFGEGLVATSGDFGVQGELPSHPQLLDWLATEFVRTGWDVKAMQRLIVTSATYRQASRISPEVRERDPRNRLLSRGARVRLPAELIRDQALAVSGLLVGGIGGPSVRPYQPAGLWREVAFDFSGNLTAQIYKQDNGASLYRRSMYTYWKRTSPPPSMQIFDAPDRERCVVRRVRTNTPLQALALLNEPTYIESSRALAERVMTEGEQGPLRRIAHAFRLVTAREPSSREIVALTTVYEEQCERFEDDCLAVEQLLGVGEYPRDTDLDPREHAAYTIVASILLNLDETITKP